MMEFQLINDGFSADFIDGFWNDIVMVFGLTNTFVSRVSLGSGATTIF